MSQSMSVHNW